MFNRAASLILIFAFFAMLIPAPPAFALRQETAQAIGTADAVGSALGAAKGVGEETVRSVLVLTDKLKSGNELVKMLAYEIEGEFDTAVEFIPPNIGLVLKN